MVLEGRSNPAFATASLAGGHIAVAGREVEAHVALAVPVVTVGSRSTCAANIATASPVNLSQCVVLGVACVFFRIDPVHQNFLLIQYVEVEGGLEKMAIPPLQTILEHSPLGGPTCCCPLFLSRHRRSRPLRCPSLRASLRLHSLATRGRGIPLPYPVKAESNG